MVLVASFSFFSCSSDDDDDDITPVDNTPKETVFFYMPYSGNLYSYFLQNIKAFETAVINNGGLDRKHLMVFIATSATNAYLYEISYNNGTCVHDTLKNYYFASADYTTSSGITSILEDVMTESPTADYSMIIGCHGMGWLPKSVNTRAGFQPAKRIESAHQTRYFGDYSSSSMTYKTDITTLAEGIKATGVKMKYILFDDCYMSNIETAYDLREATDYLIASTSEIMIEGMPYAYIGKSLLDHDYQGVCDGFYTFYSAYNPPCGTIGVTDCSETENMAYIMKTINTMYPDGLSDISDVQILDGYTPSIFFDFGDYVAHLCQDASLLSTFNAELDKLVPYKAHTAKYYSEYTEKQTTINAFSGLTISDPSQNTAYSVTEAKTQTAWYAATHNAPVAQKKKE